MSTSSADASVTKGRSLGLCGLFRNPGLYLLTLFRGKFVGRDAQGNQYFERPWTRGRTRRWVVYAGSADASKVPPEWHAWLHHLTDAPLSTPARSWQRPHRANPTGTPASYRPPGHEYQGGKRAKVSADYESWAPDQA
jgi:NADH:ubiquinone oxidoreductase subunit